MQNTDVAPSVTIQVTDFVMPDEVANPVNAIALPLFAALAVIITYLPLRSFYRVKNIAACSMMAVIIIINIMAFINGVFWPSDDWTKWWIGYGLCDIEAILRFPISMALATSLCCLTKGLADALDTEHAVMNPSKAQRRRKVIGDVLFCWLVPIMMMALHYTIQAGRYMIIPVWGCADQLDNSWPMLVIIIMWCPLFTVLNVYYAALMFYRLYRHRKTISATLTSTGSGLAPRKFIKLVLISVSTIVIYLPLQTLFVFYAIPSKFVPYSWSRIHNPVTWSPILFVHTGVQPSLQWAGWAGVAASAFMFAFFGFNDDAVDTYRAALVTCGFGKIWPSLRLSREERRASETLVNSTGSRSSFKSQFDLVGKAMKYFDTASRTESQATGTLVNGSTIASRKGSQGTFSNVTSSLSHIPTSTSTDASLLHRPSASPDLDHQAHSKFMAQHGISQFDEITGAAPHSHYDDFNHSPACLSNPQTPSSTSPLQNSLNRGVFSMFRTHLNLPFNIFATSISSSKATKSFDARDEAEMNIMTSRDDYVTHPIAEKDLEAQNAKSSSSPGTATWPRRISSTSLSTNIWSSGSPPSGFTPTPASILSTQEPHTYNSNHTHGRATAHHHKPSITTLDDESTDFVDPHSPKIGTRAYRERERREFAALSTPPASTITSTTTIAPSMHTTRSPTKNKKHGQPRKYPANAHQELGMHVLASSAQASTQRGGQADQNAYEGIGGGVIVTRSLDIQEERAAVAGSSCPTPGTGITRRPF